MVQKSLRQYFSNKTKRSQQLIAVIVVVIVAAIGTMLLISSHAASPYVATDADRGTLGGSAITQSCSGSSDGNCVVFGGSNATQTDCILSPHTCGYPDATNTGVPLGTNLIDLPSGDLRITSDGATLYEANGTQETLGAAQGVTETNGNITINGINLVGSVEIMANNVTIENSQIYNGWPIGWALRVEACPDTEDATCTSNDITGTVVEHSTLGGINTGTSSVNFAIDNLSVGAGMDAEYDQLVQCSSCYEGLGSVEHSLLDTGIYNPGAHNEDVQLEVSEPTNNVGTAAGNYLNVINDTLLNEENQTATVFLQPLWSVLNNVTVKNNLMAGGGWSISGPYQTAEGGNYAVCPSNVEIDDNRMSTVFYPPNAGNNYTGGGQYGPLAGDPSSCGGNDVASGNIWDADNLPFGDSASTGVSDQTQPNPPSNIQVTKNTCTVGQSAEVDLSWTAGSATTKYGLYGYQIYRVPSFYGDYPPQGDNAINGTTGTTYVDSALYDADPVTGNLSPDSNITCGTTYTYYITSVDAVGLQSTPATVRVTLPSN